MCHRQSRGCSKLGNLAVVFLLPVFFPCWAEDCCGRDGNAIRSYTKCIREYCQGSEFSLHLLQLCEQNPLCDYVEKQSNKKPTVIKQRNLQKAENSELILAILHSLCSSEHQTSSASAGGSQLHKEVQMLSQQMPAVWRISTQTLPRWVVKFHKKFFFLFLCCFSSA